MSSPTCCWCEHWGSKFVDDATTGVCLQVRCFVRSYRSKELPMAESKDARIVVTKTPKAARASAMLHTTHNFGCTLFCRRCEQ
jgi:hypothetical protein